MEVPCEFVFDLNTYKCIVSNVDLTTSSSIASFNGEHYHGLSNKEVNMVVFRSSPMCGFPRDLTLIFPRLTLIEVYDCGLRSIVKEDLRGLENLVFLSIVCNRVQTLPSDLFEGTPNLQFIDFGANQISRVGAAIFEPLKRIIEFSLCDNAAIDFEYIEEYRPSESAERLKVFMNVVRERCRAMESLKDMASMKLKENIDESNALDVFVCGSRFGMHGLTQKAFDVVRKKIVPRIDEELMHQPEKVLGIIEARRKEKSNKKNVKKTNRQFKLKKKF